MENLEKGEKKLLSNSRGGQKKYGWGKKNGFFSTLRKVGEILIGSHHPALLHQLGGGTSWDHTGGTSKTAKQLGW